MKCLLSCQHFLFTFYLLVPGADGDRSNNPLPALEGPFPSHKLQRSMAVPYSGDDIVESEWSTMWFNLYIYIIRLCLFVRDSRLNYAKNSHQSLRNYRDPLGRTTPRIGVTRPVVSMAFPVYFRYSLSG